MTLVEEIERRENGRQTPLVEGDVRHGYAVLIAMAMFAVNATLAVLVRTQYHQDVSVSLILRDCWAALPLFAVLSLYFRPSNLQKQLIACSASCTIGCYLVHIFNNEGYYASMSRAPSLGTLWIWLFLETEWYFGAAALAAVGAYTWMYGYNLI